LDANRFFENWYSDKRFALVRLADVATRELTLKHRQVPLTEEERTKIQRAIEDAGCNNLRPKDETVQILCEIGQYVADQAFLFCGPDSDAVREATEIEEYIATLKQE